MHHIANLLADQQTTKPGVTMPKVSQPPATVPVNDLTDAARVAFWITMPLSLCTSTMIAYLISQRSPHIKGSTHDADFWAQLQACITQVLSGIATFAQIYQGRDLSSLDKRFSLSALVLCMSCGVASVILYPLAPTELSVMLNLIAGTLQSFVLVGTLVWQKQKMD